MKTLFDFLCGLPAQDQARLAADYLPDRPVPTGKAQLREFAALLASPARVTETASVLTLPELQVAEVLALRGSGTRRRDLAHAMGLRPDDADLDRVLSQLELHALAWPDADDWIRTASLHEVLVGGYGFGPSARLEFAQLRVDALQRMAYELGAPVSRDRTTLVNAVSAALADAATVREQFAAAPDVIKELLLELADGDPFYFDPRQMGALRAGKVTPLRWAVDRGLLSFNPYGMAAVLPSEVGVVLREGFRAEFDPAPPPQPTVEVSAEMVQRDGAAAVRHAVAQVTALLDELSRTPAPMLKDGGIGVRELRRLAKAIGGNDVDLRLWLVLAGVSALLGVADHKVAPSAYYDEWLKLDPPTQFRRMLTAWFAMDATPLDTTTAALLRTERDAATGLLRRSLVTVVARLPDGRAATGLEGINAILVYLRPLVTGEPEDAFPTTAMLWRELELMGLAAQHAPTALCRALMSGDDELLTAEVERLVPAAQSTVLLQSDLTAVATGMPAADLAGLLDLAADRESRGGGHTWRFSAGSVRRALDTGTSPDELLDALRAAATGGKVPQPLEYLIADLGRRHGAVRVRPVGCVLRSDDTTLLAELLRVRSLARLGLTELAPTVLGSTLPVEETLAALRAAGYAPAGESADGTIAFDRITRHRVGLPQP